MPIKRGKELERKRRKAGKSFKEEEGLPTEYYIEMYNHFAEIANSEKEREERKRKKRNQIE